MNETAAAMAELAKKGIAHAVGLRAVSQGSIAFAAVGAAANVSPKRR